MRARYYSPELRRFVNADIVAGSLDNAITLNRFAYANGNPVSFIDPFGLCAYDRDAAIRYAEKYYDSHNSEYMPLDTVWFTIWYALNYFTFTGKADCANFVSQCLEAGGVEQTDEWYYYSQENSLITPPYVLGPQLFRYMDADGKLTHRVKDYYFSAPWTIVTAQYNYFSNKLNGYTSVDPIFIGSSEDIETAISTYGIEKGDLLYWSKDKGQTLHHATMICEVTEEDILFTGHTDPAFDKSVSDTMQKKKESIVIIKMNDYLRETYYP